MNKSIQKYHEDMSIDDNKNIVIESRNVHQQNESHVSNKCNLKLEFIKLSEQNSNLGIPCTIAKLGLLCYYSQSNRYIYKLYRLYKVYVDKFIHYQIKLKYD